MDKIVKIRCLGGWCKVYGDAAKVVSFVMDYKLFEDHKTGIPTVGFPLYSLEKVIDNLESRKINYQVDNRPMRNYGVKNGFDRYYHDNLPYSYVVEETEKKKRPTGTFTVRFLGEEPETLIIDEDIDKDAELVQKVISNEVGTVFSINEFKIELIEKEIEFI